MINYMQSCSKLTKKTNLLDPKCYSDIKDSIIN